MAVQIDIAGACAEDDGTHTLFLRERGGRTRIGGVAMSFSDIAAIVASLNGLTGHRASTYGIWARTVQSAGITLRRLIINGFGGDDGIICLLEFCLGPRIWTVDCRPSDGLSLAIRLGAPIECEEPILDLMVRDRTERTQRAARESDEQWHRYFVEHDDTLPKA